MKPRRCGKPCRLRGESDSLQTPHSLELTGLKLNPIRFPFIKHNILNEMKYYCGNTNTAIRDIETVGISPNFRNMKLFKSYTMNLQILKETADRIHTRTSFY